MSRLAIGLLIGIMFLTVPAVDGDSGTPRAGVVKTLAGEATIERAGRTLRPRGGDPVCDADVLRTGADGRLGVTFEDDTRVSLAPGSAMRVARVRYAPAQGRVEMVLQFLRGAAGYVSGRIAKLAPDAVRLETPNAIVGVRGTTVFIEVDAP